MAMFRKYFQPKTLLKNTFAALLMLALSGAYCLCCGYQTAAAAGKTEHCRFSKPPAAEHCNFSKQNSSEASKTAVSVNSFERCGLKLKFFVAKLEKKEFPQQTSALVNNFNFLQPAKPERKTGFAGFFYRAPVSDRSDLHLRNRVFRI